ncbi:ArsR/SmtB family transcription factor [Avibacterium sp. 21-594]|uniref:ArsR/SmtB family transcription factor n=1 Tax=Avibacterium sp. 21-594 TaxID=2911535 RepID=UPI0022472210|nr:transcriptional regulator [Avibacterium sp. 21-594]MCW9716259.1 transcriptional regulator [Avibacterium sp. 21-594]
MTTTIETLKALSNESRLQMLQWLKSPHAYFTSAEFSSEAIDADGGVCVQAVVIKSGLAQSVVSSYLNSLKNAGLLEMKRTGKWTYYRYNTQAVADFLQQLATIL